MATKKPGDRIKKDPDAAEEPYVMNWTALVDELSATIAASVWVVDGPDADLVVVTDSIVTGAKKTQVTLSGGTLGADYALTNRVTLSTGYIDDRSVTITIGEK